MFKISLVFVWLSVLLSSATAVRPWLSFPLSDWAFLAGILVSLPKITVLCSSGVQLTRIFYFLGAALIVLGAVISGWDHAPPEQILLYTIKIAYTFVIYIPVFNWASVNKNFFDKLRHAWIYSGAIAGVSATLQKYNNGSLLGIEAVYGRMTGLTEHPNELGMVTALIMPLIVHKLVAERGLWMLLCNICLLAMILAGLLLSQSITALIGGLVGTTGGLVVTCWRSHSRIRAIWAGFIIIICLAPLGYLMQDTFGEFWERIIFTKRGDQQTTLDSRILGFYEIALKSGGINLRGSGVNAVVDSEGNSVHNMFLRVGVEVGLCGLIGILIITGSILRIAIQKIRLARPDDIGAKVSVLWSYVVFLVGGQASPVLLQRNLWLPAMLILARDTKAEESSKPLSRSSQGGWSPTLANARR